MCDTNASTIVHLAKYYITKPEGGWKVQVSAAEQHVYIARSAK